MKERLPFFDQSAPLPNPEFTVALNSQVVFGVHGRTEVTLANLRPQVDKTTDRSIALFAFAKNSLHDVV